MKARRVTNPDGTLYGVRFDCPGCGDPHVVPVKPNERGWDFNGDFDRPTLGPSILVHPHGALAEDGSVYQTPTCHSFVRDGRIEYCGDSTHALAGQTVDLPALADTPGVALGRAAATPCSAAATGDDAEPCRNDATGGD